MKEVKETKEIKNVENNDLPIATLVINEYKNINDTLKETNNNLQKVNKGLTIFALILLILFAIETTYIIIYWDTLHPHAGAVRVKSDE